MENTQILKKVTAIITCIGDSSFYIVFGVVFVHSISKVKPYMNHMNIIMNNNIDNNIIISSFRKKERRRVHAKNFLIINKNKIIIILYNNNLSCNS